MTFALHHDLDEEGFLIGGVVFYIFDKHIQSPLENRERRTKRRKRKRKMKRKIGRGGWKVALEHALLSAFQQSLLRHLRRGRLEAVLPRQRAPMGVEEVEE